jgi:hypothetical protein
MVAGHPGEEGMHLDGGLVLEIGTEVALDIGGNLGALVAEILRTAKRKMRSARGLGQASSGIGRA